MNIVTPFAPTSASPALDKPSTERILENLSHPVLALNAEGGLVYANAAAEASLGGWVTGLNIRDLFPGFSLPSANLSEAWSMVLVTKKDVAYEATLTPLGNGQFVVDLRVPSDRQELAIVTDLDDLTGLAKRNMLMSHLTGALNRDAGTAIAVHCLDLDRFKMC